ncbi:MAG: IS1096 element passenger TnpR family protein [Phocaeicola sp.]
MIYRFTIISDEVDDFIREIQIDSEANFFDLHEAILSSVGYNNEQITSFFTCDEDWEKEVEITLEDMGGSSEEDTYVMKDTALSTLLEDEKQKLLYVFDPLAERLFFIELSEIITGKGLDKAACTRKAGEAPTQTVNFEELFSSTGGSVDLDETFYGDQEFDMEDFDPEGFDMGGSAEASDSYGSEKYE